MLRWLYLIVVLVTTTASARLTTFAWNNGANWPAGTTVELCSNGVCESGIATTQHTLDVPIQPGERYDAKVRAVTPAGTHSEWTTLIQTLPSPGIGLWARYKMGDITTGLIAHWKLDETSGTTATDSAGSNDSLVDDVCADF